MGKRSATPTGKSKQDKGGNTDDDVMEKRRVIDSFEASDLILGVVGWALWGVAAIWFLYFGQGTPLNIPSDPVITLAGCGWLCSGLCKSSPKGSWSQWRVLWQTLWIPAWALLALAMAQVAVSPLGAFQDHGWNYDPFSSLTAWIWTSCFALAAGAVAYFLPVGPPTPKAAADAPMAKLLFRANMVYGLAAAFFAISGAPWKQGLGPQGALFAAVPFAMWGLGIGSCTTQQEMVRALPGAILIHFSAICRVLMFGSGGGVLVLLVSVVMFACHFALFLPLPLGEPESNIFYLHRLKLQQSCYRMISNPVIGVYTDDD